MSGAAYTVLTALYLRMTPGRFVGAVAPDPGDPIFNLTILRWVASRVPHLLDGVWSPTFFWPTRGVLALSDHLIGPGILTALLELLGCTPAAVYNTFLLSALAGGALAAHLVFRLSGLSIVAAAFGAIAWSFSAARWEELSHLQVLLVTWIPWTLWSFDRLLAEPTPRRAASFAAAYALHVSGGAYLAYLVHLPLAAIALSRLFLNRALSHFRRAVTIWLFTGISCLGFFLWMYLPYTRFRADLGIATTRAMIEPHRIHAGSFFTVGPRTIYSDLMPERLQAQSGALYVGFLVLGFLIYELACRWRRRGVGVESGALDLSPGWWRALGVAGVVSAICCLSGVARLLRQVLPGFEAIRVPARLFIFASFAAAAFAGAGVDRFVARCRKRSLRIVGASAVLALVAVEAFTKGKYTEWTPVPAPAEIPAVYRWIASRPGIHAIAEFPLRVFWRESERMYFGTVHGRRLLNGYSGYYPLAYRKIQALLVDFPGPLETSRLEALGMSHLVVHRDELSRADRRRWRAWNRKVARAKPPWLVLEAELDDAVVYRVASAESR